MKTLEDSEHIRILKDEVREVDKAIDKFGLYMTAKEINKEAKAIYKNKIDELELKKKALIQDIIELMRQEKFEKEQKTNVKF